MQTAVATNQLYAALDQYFGFPSFKGTQEQIIKSVLAGKDTLVIMPTGGGKSLCYQLPAMMSEGTALVISPLIALMKNQVDMVRGYSSQEDIAHFLNSSLSRNQIKQVKQDLLDGKTKLLYVAPETLTKQDTIDFFKQIQISFVAVDEAHCISEWGHDFRPEYRRIREMVNAINPNVPIIALTATATPKVRTDIVKNLQQQNPDTYISSFNRDNLYYELRPKGKKDYAITEIIKFVKKHPNKSGIVYCLNRKTTETIAESLQVNGIKAGAYHAGLDSGTRSRRQDQFLMEDVHVIVATIAFGMGIDKPDVRFVVHYDIPKSLENYYQETGRAGRDGLEGICVAFFSYADINKLEKFMRDKPVAEREIGGQHLLEVVGYAESAICRRQGLLHYFGEDYDANRCNSMCDNCRHPKEKLEGKDDIKMTLQAVDSLQENFAIKYVINFLLGKGIQEIIAFKHNQLPLFAKGKGKHKDVIFWNSIIRQALLKNLLKKDIENYGLLKLTDKGRKYIKKPYSVLIAINHQFDTIATPINGYANKTTVLDPNLMRELKELRRKIAKRRKLPTFVIFQDPSLEEMATYYPTTLKELEKITGVSQGKARKYGKNFVKLVAEYVQLNDIHRPTEAVVKSIANKSKDKIFIIQNIDKKIPLETIARNLNLDMESLLSEVESIVASGTKVNIGFHINNFLDEDQQDEIYDYFLNLHNDTTDFSADNGSEENGIDIHTQNSKKIERFSLKLVQRSLRYLQEEYDDEYTEEDIRLMFIKFMSEKAN